MLGARAGDAVNKLRNREVIGKCDTKNLYRSNGSMSGSGEGGGYCHDFHCG